MKYILFIAFTCFFAKISFSQEFTFNELKEIFLGDTTVQKNILSSHGFKSGPAVGRHPLQKGLKRWSKGEDQRISFWHSGVDNSVCIEGIYLVYHFDDPRIFKAIHKTLTQETLPAESVGGLSCYYDFEEGLIYAFNKSPEPFEARLMNDYIFFIFKTNEAYKRSGRTGLEGLKKDIDYGGIFFQAKSWWQIQVMYLNKYYKNLSRETQSVYCYGIKDGLKEFLKIEIEKDSLRITRDTLKSLVLHIEKELRRTGKGIHIEEPYYLNYAGGFGFALDFSKKGINVRKMVLNIAGHIVCITQMAYKKDLNPTFQDIDKSVKFEPTQWFQPDPPHFDGILNKIE